MVVLLFAVTYGRQYYGWQISGHFTCVLAIALAQTTDKRLHWIERTAYWIPVPIVLCLRVFYLVPAGEEITTLTPLLVALPSGVIAAILAFSNRARQEERA